MDLHLPRPRKAGRTESRRAGWRWRPFKPRTVRGARPSARCAACLPTSTPAQRGALEVWSTAIVGFYPQAPSIAQRGGTWSASPDLHSLGFHPREKRGAPVPARTHDEQQPSTPAQCGANGDRDDWVADLIPQPPRNAGRTCAVVSPVSSCAFNPRARRGDPSTSRTRRHVLPPTPAQRGALRQGSQRRCLTRLQPPRNEGRSVVRRTKVRKAALQRPRKAGRTATLGHALLDVSFNPRETRGERGTGVALVDRSSATPAQGGANSRGACRRQTVFLQTPRDAGATTRF